jgi:hypothetical protein
MVFYVSFPIRVLSVAFFRSRGLGQDNLLHRSPVSITKARNIPPTIRD